MTTTTINLPKGIEPRLRVLCVIAILQNRMHGSRPYLKDVATELGRDPATITGHVGSLSEDDLVDHSAGCHRCALTESGAALARRILAAMSEPATNSQAILRASA